MDQRKRDRYAPFQSALAAGGIDYQPFAVSCWGRLHPDAERMLQCLAKRVARRDGSTNLRSVVVRFHARIVTELMRRAARMVLACLPRAQSLDDPSPLPQDGPEPSVHASLRAGHPGLSFLPPLHLASSGVSGSEVASS